LKPELATIERLVNSKLNDLAATAPEMANIDDAVRELQAEGVRLRHVFIKAAFKCKEAYIFRLYIHHHQAELIRVVNIAWQAKSKATGLVMQDFCDKSIAVIDGLLLLMQQSFGDYFDRAQAVPYYYHARTKPVVQKQLIHFKRQCMLAVIGDHLQQIVVAIYDGYLQKKEADYSYQRYCYLQYLSRQLQNFGNEAELSAQLFAANFNNNRFFLYSVNAMKNLIDNSTTPTQLTIGGLIKTNNQVIIDKTKSLHPHKPDIQHMLSIWLYEELGYWDIQQPALVKGASADKILQHLKVKLNLSVDELGYWVDLLEKTEILENNSRTGITKALAEVCSTKERTHIAWKSLYNNSYHVSPHTQTKVKDMLLKMLNVATKKVYFFITLLLNVDVASYNV
jgi:hypothetical protein